MTQRRLRLGVAGLGRGFSLMQPGLAAHPRIVLVAAADPRPEARARFAAEFGAKAYAGVEELCGDPAVEAIYVATPHQFHAQQVALAAAAGKHVLVEKPMALSLAECAAMIAATERAKVHLIVGHSHGFDRPVERAREIIAGGEVGAVRMITALNFTDFLYRPRRTEELDTAAGGGVFFNQAPHQVDIVRLLGGGRVRSVRAHSGAWDRARPTDGAYGALLSFDDGIFASLTYSGFAHFDSDEWCDWIGESGHAKAPEAYGSARRLLAGAAGAQAELAAKNARNYGGANFTAMAAGNAPFHEHFGVVIASCERADLRPTPKGLIIHGDDAVRFETLPPRTPRAEVLDELCAAVLDDKPPRHSGRWGLATMEVCLAMLQSAREEREIILRHQVGLLGA